MKTPPMWQAGDPVVLWSDSENPRCTKEYGVVVSTYYDSRCGWWDCWVAFFVNRWPKDGDLHKTKPYILRYLETSLKHYVPKETKTRSTKTTSKGTKGRKYKSPWAKVPTCDLCNKPACWKHPIGDLRCATCPRPTKDSTYT